MAKFIALWGTPEDAEGFENHYRNTHIPLCEKWPGIQSLSTTKISGDAMGGASPHHLVFEATFASRDDLKAALRSPEMMAAGKDAMTASKEFGSEVTMLVGDDF